MGKQIWSLLSTHMISVLVIAAFGFMITVSIMDKPVLYTLASFVMTALYFSSIYQKAWELAHQDKMSATTTSVYMLKGAVLSVGVAVFNLVLWLIYLFAWNYLTIDGSLASLTGIIYNLLYVVNTFAYSGFAEISHGFVAPNGHLLIYLVPLLASTFGYIAGVYDFTLSSKLMPLVYEKKKDE